MSAASPDDRIVHTVIVYADVGGLEHSVVIADEVDGQLRTGPEFDVDGGCDLVVPANAGAFGNELLVSLNFSDLAAFVHAVEAREQSS
ncbi:hypothetical protein VXE65_20345 [Mycolicibacterium conceptionense]|uniref:hypothetical protein n=1 Tax=Mycolicibacterium conceptionense TaxID=451644 RepID=UPI003204AA13